MDGAEYKDKKDPYDVLVIGLNGAASVYQEVARSNRAGQAKFSYLLLLQLFY